MYATPTQPDNDSRASGWGYDASGWGRASGWGYDASGWGFASSWG